MVESPAVEFDDKKLVWAPDAGEGFVLGTIVDKSGESTSVSIKGTNNRVVTSLSENVFFAEEDTTREYNDNCELMYLNEATLLHNLRLRYEKDKIYTYVANVLIAVNPYQEIPNLSSTETMLQYKGKSLGVLPPHVFAIADKTYRDMLVYKQSQSINVSGESGSGKTETTKYIIRYLTETYGQGCSGEIERRIVEANPLLEAFGNAKTLRNLNSSRFGKYVEIHFDKRAKITGAFVSHYLLEKTRVCSQSSKERNYHVFYGMCAGLEADMKSAYKIAGPSEFEYLNKSSLEEPYIDDPSRFEVLDQAMDDVGITTQQKSDIYRIVSIVLHLGNIEFQGNANRGCFIASSSNDTISHVAELMGLDAREVHMTLTTRIMVVTAKGKEEKSKVPLTPDQAISNRDAFAKSIYSHLFDYIVACVNESFPFEEEKSERYIGVLDIAGFEIFDENRFDQFCINYCNERLQQFFYERIMKEEQRLYQNEGLGLKEIHFTDNADCIDLFERKVSGIMDLLDDEMKFPAPSEQHFTLEVYQQNKDHIRLAVPRKSPNPPDRQLKEDEGFLIRHFAGAVCYQTDGFLSRNNDALHENLEQLIHQSSDPFLRNLFPTPTPPLDRQNSKGGSKKKTAFESIGRKFREQLKLLIVKLTNTGSNFVRCIKPNDYMKKHMFNGGLILRQLQCAGMVSVLHLMQEGYPSRTSFATLYNNYKSLLPSNKIPKDPRIFCKTLFYALGLDNTDFAFGITKAFFRPGKFAAFDQLVLADPQFLTELMDKVVKWIIRYRWRRLIYADVAVLKCANKIRFRQDHLIVIQKFVRMFLAVRKHKPRYECLRNLRNLDTEIGEVMEVVESLLRKKDIYGDKVKELKVLRDQESQKIKRIVMNRSEIDTLFSDFVEKIESVMEEVLCEKEAQEEEERRKALLRYNWRRAIWCAVSVQKLANKIIFRQEHLVVIQKYVRMFLAVRKHKPRYEGLTKLITLETTIGELEEFVTLLKKNKETYQEKVNKIKKFMELAIKKVKRTIMKEREISSLYTTLMKKIEAQKKELEDEKAAQEEQERLARIIYRLRWKRAIYCAVSVQKLANKIKLRQEMRLRIQKTVRMFLAVRKYKPLYDGLRDLKILDTEIAELRRIASSLKKHRESYLDKADDIQIIMDETLEDVRKAIISQEEIDRLYTDIRKKLKSVLQDVRAEKAVQREEERRIKMEQLGKLQLSFLMIGRVGDISKKFEDISDEYIATRDRTINRKKGSKKQRYQGAKSAAW